MKAKIKQCVYCQREHGQTKDHVFPKGFFPESYNKINLITVPSCNICNVGYSKDEQYFIHFITNISAENSSEAKELHNTKIKRSIQHSKKLGEHILNKMELVDSYSKSGIYIGKKTKIEISKVDWARYHNVLDKFIKGLFYTELNLPMPTNFRMKHIMGDINNQEHLKTFYNLNKSNYDNKEVFAYHFNNIPETYESIWITIFFKHIFFITFAVSEERYLEFEEYAKQKKVKK